MDITVEELIGAVSPPANDSVPDSIRTDLLLKLKHFLGSLERRQNVFELDEQVIANGVGHRVVGRLRDGANEFLNGNVHAALLDDALAPLLHLVAPAAVDELLPQVVFQLLLVAAFAQFLPQRLAQRLDKFGLGCFTTHWSRTKTGNDRGEEERRRREGEEETETRVTRT